MKNDNIKNKKNKTLLIIGIITTILLLTLGITYAVFTYRETGTSNNQLVLGDIYMHYNETNQLKLENAMPSSSIKSFSIPEEVIGYLVNPIMATQTEEDTELAACISYISIYMSGKTKEEIMKFCQGSGIGYAGYDFQNNLDRNGFSDTAIQEMLELNIIIEEVLPQKTYTYTNLIVNPNMEGEVLENCKTIFTNSNYYFYDGPTGPKANAEDFCKGIGVAMGGYAYYRSFSELAGDVAFLTSTTVGKELFRKGVVLAKFDLPYFEFQISGKNTYTKQDISYEILLSHGDVPENKSIRIKDSDLMFRLVKMDENNNETVLVPGVNYADINNKSIWVETINKNTIEEVNNRYRLYMWIDEDVVICGGEASESCDYYTSGDTNNWNDVFASIKVNVKGDFVEKKDFCSMSVKNITDFSEYATNCKPQTVITDTDGTVYLSGGNEAGITASGEYINDENVVDYNYLWYSGKLWRITAINPDGTLKLVTDDNMTVISYGSDVNFYTDENTTSYIYQWLNEDFLDTLYNYENIIVTDSSWNVTMVAAENYSKKIEENAVTAPVGLLNSYDYYISHKNFDLTSSSYLNIGLDWWLLNPQKGSTVWMVNSHGSGYDIGYRRYIAEVPSSNVGVRPSINLKSTIQLVGGSGTVSDPYRIKGDRENIEENVTLINTRGSGEYVKLSSDETAPIFRIIGTELVGENLTTKIVLNDYVKDTNDVDADSNTTEVLTKKFSSSNSYELWTEVDKTDTTYWRGYLNNIWIKEIDTTYNGTDGTSSILEKGTYYLGYYTSGSYKTSVCATVSSDMSVRECIENGTVVTNTSSDDYVGLLRVGEMFASPTRDYSKREAEWLITPYNSSYVHYFSINGDFYNYRPGSANFGARPSVNLKSTILVKSGSGTLQDPFVVGLPS